ncbi:Glyoxalase [Pantoea agglomerans]|nr:Glyoxalase [Pantoea agglomerans]EZI33400.1 Glyoxalase [Pantoea agglomerans]
MSTNVIRGMDHVGITVSDIDEATRFFSDAFVQKLFMTPSRLQTMT